MEILQDEFIHHQSKVDEYHRLKKMVEQIDGMCSYSNTNIWNREILGNLFQ